MAGASWVLVIWISAFFFSSYKSFVFVSLFSAVSFLKTSLNLNADCIAPPLTIRVRQIIVTTGGIIVLKNTPAYEPTKIAGIITVTTL